MKADEERFCNKKINGSAQEQMLKGAVSDEALVLMAPINPLKFWYKRR